MLAQAESRPEIAAVRGMLEQQDFNIFYNAPALIVICASGPDEMTVILVADAERESRDNALVP